MALKKYSPRVPRDYQEIEYLKCNGTQYIDTGLVGSDLSNCEIEAIMKNETTDTTAYNFNGAFLSGSTAQFGLVATSSTECRATINFGFVSAIGVTNLALSQYHTFYIKNGLQKVDGVTIDTLNLGTLNGQKFLLFARTNSSDSSITNCPAMSLKAFSVKSNGSYIRNMIPVRRISDGELGLYDTANNVFYTNQGTNSFIAGSDVDNWKDIPYRRYETATDAVTTLPVEIFTDGQPVSSYTIKGNTETSGTPSPQNPVTVDGVGEETANLFDVNNETGITNNTYINQQGSLISNNSYYLSAPIAVQENTVYTWQFGGTISHTAPTTGFYDSTDTLISVATHTSGYSYSFTTPANCTYVRQSVYQYGKNEAMLSETPDVIPFEPYGKYKISILKDLSPLTPIYLSQPLRKSLDGTAFDTLDSTGLVTYNVDEYGQPQTATTETVTVPTITTTGGTITLDVDTTIKPSELDLTYHGWHTHEPLKRENGQWV